MRRVMHMLHTLDVAVGEEATTVRRGDKWANSLGADLLLCVCSAPCLAPLCCDDPDAPTCPVCDRQGTGRVVELWNGWFCDIPARLIEHEHEERSRHYSGLLDSMRKAYGPTFGPQEQVTVVKYRRKT